MASIPRMQCWMPFTLGRQRPPILRRHAASMPPEDAVSDAWMAHTVIATALLQCRSQLPSILRRHRPRLPRMQCPMLEWLALSSPPPSSSAAPSFRPSSAAIAHASQGCSVRCLNGPHCRHRHRPPPVPPPASVHPLPPSPMPPKDAVSDAWMAHTVIIACTRPPPVPPPASVHPPPPPTPPNDVVSDAWMAHTAPPPTVKGPPLQLSWEGPLVFLPGHFD